MSKFSRPLKYHEKRHSPRVSFKGLHCAGDHTWSSIWIPINNISSRGAAAGGSHPTEHPLCLLLCFIKPILGNRYGPGVSSQTSQGSTYPRCHCQEVWRNIFLARLLFPCQIKLTKILYQKWSVVQILFLKENLGSWANTQPTPPMYVRKQAINVPLDFKAKNGRISWQNLGSQTGCYCCVLSPPRSDTWSLSHLGHLYPGTTPVMIKLDHNRSCPWV